MKSLLVELQENLLRTFHSSVEMDLASDLHTISKLWYFKIVLRYFYTQVMIPKVKAIMKSFFWEKPALLMRKIKSLEKKKDFKPEIDSKILNPSFKDLFSTCVFIIKQFTGN